MSNSTTRNNNSFTSLCAFSGFGRKLHYSPHVGIHFFRFISYFMRVPSVAYHFSSIIYLTGKRQGQRQEDIHKIVRTPAAFVESRPFRLYKRLVDTEMEENFGELIIDGEIIKSVVRCKQCYTLLAKPIGSRAPLMKHLETLNCQLQSGQWGKK